MKITLIVAHDNNNAIGKEGDMPWHLPDDLKWFKQHTQEKIVVMGRTTWESLSLQPLPNRINLVMTTKNKYSANGAVLCHSVTDVLTIAMVKQMDELMITGGGEIYKLFYPLADRLIVTEVNTTIQGADAFFANYPKKHWEESFREYHPKDNRHAYDFTFKILEKKSL